ncbi:hypothetical protein [Oxalobacter paraformigenes]|uniref:Uncharacterized protein n=1 Tax=Oxalobacter paraformigenes TaxID=556268 RepID=C3X455_9BURK|nr:hypothetical protein [Oxalobacter paraformigenes]EEO27991.2 hypothetical protein OFAG_01144 [Oxalobacter paraformigenes]
MNHLTREPVAVRDHTAFCRRPGVRKKDLGETTRPTGAQMTRFRIDAGAYRVRGRRGKSLYLPEIKVEEACSSGHNESFYLPKGWYSSGQMCIGGFFGDFMPVPGEREIRYYISREISEQGRQAEREHCEDIVHAYEITLLAAEQVIRCAKTFFERRRIPVTFEAAMRQVYEKLVREAPHEKIRRIFRECINPKTGEVRSLFGTRMRELYLATADRTLKRDEEQWHTFRYDETEYRPRWYEFGYKTDRYDYRMMKQPLKRESGMPSPSTASLITLD